VERVVLCRGWSRVLLVLGVVLCCLVAVASDAFALPDGRGYELVSPVAKNGTGVVSDSQRTRAAATGDAFQFLSLGAFGDAMGTGIATEYVSERTGVPGSQGWSTHAITPLQSGTTFDGIADGLESRYVGEFTPDLSKGVFLAQSPVTGEPFTTSVPNLYRRDDLLSAGAGSYDLVTACPLCVSAGALPAPGSADAAVSMVPYLAWMSPDASRMLFESRLRLTADASSLGRVEAFEWNNGSVTLAGRVPRSGGRLCDDVHGPGCVSALSSIAGEGASNFSRTPHTISNGSDGHVRMFFTVPTMSGGQAGQLYMRVDGTLTVQLNVSERSTPDSSHVSPAGFLDASANGERAFFETRQALTDDTPADGASHIYMYDASLPPSAPSHLTYLNADHEPADGTSTDGRGIAGLGNDGDYVYFASDSQLVSGGPLGVDHGLYLWHDGAVQYIASLNDVNMPAMTTAGPSYVASPYQSRVSPDGRWLLYRAVTGPASQLFLFSAEGGGSVCVSCDPSGAPTVAPASDVVRTDNGGSNTSWHENHALADDGSRVFFSTTQPLVPEDVNGRVDAYEWTAAGTHGCVSQSSVIDGCVALLSSGTDASDSWFLDASPSGDNVFFSTRQQLVGWDVDQEYDVYDARVGGGVPDPPATVPPCSGSVCRGPLASPPLGGSPASAVFSGAGNAAGKLKPRTRSCRKGFVRKRVRGRLRCVKRPKRARKRAVKARRTRGHAHTVARRRTA